MLLPQPTIFEPQVFNLLGQSLYGQVFSIPLITGIHSRLNKGKLAKHELILAPSWMPNFCNVPGVYLAPGHAQTVLWIHKSYGKI